MVDEAEEFTLKLRSKIVIYLLFTLVGFPMLYAAYLNFQGQELVVGSLMVALFIAWSLVILLVMGFKIKLTDSSISRVGIFSPCVLEFDEIETIHFGSTWSDFHIESNGTKIFISKDFENHEDIIHRIIDKIKNVRTLEDVEFKGEDEKIKKYTSEE